MLVGLSINPDCTKSKSFGDNCRKSNGNISNGVGNEEFVTEEELMTEEELVTEKELVMQKEFVTEEKLETEEKIETEDLEGLE